MGTDYIKEYGKCQLGGIQLLSIIGEIEGHECVSENTKSTKYEHLLPILASVEGDFISCKYRRRRCIMRSGSRGDDCWDQ